MKIKTGLTFILSIAFILSLSACKDEEDLSSNSAPASTNSSIESTIDSSDIVSESTSEEYVEILPDGSLDNPFWLIDDVTELHLEAGATAHFASRNSNSLTLQIAHESVSVLLDDVTYTAENGVVSFQITPQIGTVTFFSVTNHAATAIDTTLQTIYPLGSMMNPIILTGNSGEIAAEIPQGGSMYYKWIATEDGTFTVLSYNPRNYISLQNGYVQSDATWGEQSTSIACTAGDEIIITVGTTDNEADIIDFEYHL